MTGDHVMSWPQPRRPRTFYFFSVLAGLAAVGAILQAWQHDWGNAAAQALVCIVLLTVPWRLTRR